MLLVPKRGFLWADYATSSMRDGAAMPGPQKLQRQDEQSEYSSVRDKGYVGGDRDRKDRHEYASDR